MVCEIILVHPMSNQGHLAGKSGFKKGNAPCEQALQLVGPLQEQRFPPSCLTQHRARFNECFGLANAKPVEQMVSQQEANCFDVCRLAASVVGIEKIP